MKAKFITFVRGLKNGTPPRFQSYLKSLTILLGLVLSVNLMAENSPKIEGFETATANTSYAGTVTVGSDKSDCAIAWTIYLGNVSTTNAITGANSVLIRHAKNATVAGYLQSTIGIKGLKKISFNAWVTAISMKFQVYYSTDAGTNWNALTTSDVALSSKENKQNFSYDIPNADVEKSYIIKIAVTDYPTSKHDIVIDDVTFTYKEASSKTLSSIAVTTDPKKEYTTCETLDLSGCVVTATYSDNSTENVTSQCTFDPADGDALTTSVTSAAVSYGGKETSINDIVVTEGASDTYVDNVHSSVISGDFSCSYSAPPILDKQKGATESCEDTHYHFVGWVEEGTTPIQSPSNVIPAGTAMTGSNKTYKAVWAKEAE